MSGWLRSALTIPQVKFFITGRPELWIRSGFRLASLRPITEVLRLHNVERSSVDNDIKLFFRTQLTDIVEDRSDCGPMVDWPSSQEINVLCEKSAGLFIYASMVIKFVASKYHSPTERLALIISPPQSTIHEGKSGIDLLYAQVLEHAFHDMCMDNEFYHHLRSVLGAVVLTFNPLSMETLATLLKRSDISTTLRFLHSLLLIPDNKAEPVRVLHKSFPDFLVDPGRCKDKRFLINPSVHHRRILFSCLNLMKEKLKRNICNLKHYAIPNKVKDISTRRKNHIGSALQYACQFWTKHLMEIPSSGWDIGEVHRAIDEFFTTHLLFWIEVLVVMESFDVSIYAINDIQQWYISVSDGLSICWSPCLYYVQAGLVCEWADDSQHLILEYFDMIHNSPSEIYNTIPFTPSSSWLHEWYDPKLLQGVKVIRGLQAEWGKCSRSVSLNCSASSLACWRDTIAVGSRSSDIIILNAITGITMSVLSGHTQCVQSLTFSQDGVFLVSGSRDTTVGLWDVQTGGLVMTFCGHTHAVCSTSISLDCTTVASGSQDKAIRLWDAQTGVCHCVIDKHSDTVNSVGFFPANAQLLVSASKDNTIQQWDINGKQVGPSYKGCHFTLSPNGTYLVSWKHFRGVATVLNLESGMVVAKLQAPSSRFVCCCFSPNSKFMAGSTPYAIYIWDFTNKNPCLIETFGNSGHNTITLSLSHVISLSDRSIKFWPIGTSSIGSVSTDSESPQVTSASIISIILQVKYGIAISTDEAGVVKSWDIPTGHCEVLFSTKARPKSLRDAWLICDDLVYVLCTPKIIHIWNIGTNDYYRKIDARSDFSTTSLRISGDGSRIFLQDYKYIQALSTSTGEVVGEVKVESLLYHKPPIVDDHSRIWVHLKNSQTQGWDFSRNLLYPVPISKMPPAPDRPSMGFVGVTKGWDTSLSRIEDVVTREVVYQLPRRYREPTAAQWDGQYLVAGYESGEVLILDFNHMISW